MDQAVAVRRLAVIAVVIAVGAAVLWVGRDPHAPRAEVPATDATWSGLDPQARCDSAEALITAPVRWPVRCRWRTPGDYLAAQSFPPPKGPPPYDDPHVEVYVTPTQSRESLARAIAHELGHMRHTREPTFVADWLAARNLDPQTPPEVWTEDYAEVFATLFGPSTGEWYAPTPRPSPGALADLKARFFADVGSG